MLQKLAKNLKDFYFHFEISNSLIVISVIIELIINIVS